MEQAETNGCDEADFRNGGDMAVESAEMMQEEVRELNCILYSLGIFRHIFVKPQTTASEMHMAG